MKLKNNKKAVNDLWHEFEPYIRKLCEYKLQSLPNHIDDCVQEVFLDLTDALHKGKKIEYPKAWLTKVANNKIYKLRYTASTRTSNPLVQKMRANNINQPVFNKASDKIKGLTFCVNGLWGNEIIVKSYTCNGSSYSCTLTFTLYDHFGLNEPDIDKYGGTHEGFRDWYILQHFKEYNGAYKPFVSKMSFDVSFSGTI